MKGLLFSYLIAGSALLFSCNSGEEKKSETPATDNNTATTTDNSDLPKETPTFTNVDPKVATGINEVIDHYIHIKTALGNDDSQEAASGGNAMAAALGKIDHAALAQDQMKLFMDVSEALKEHAEHIADNAKNIDHQREHFVTMSGDVYDLVKGFGYKQPLYVDNCPMANDNKGADWLSQEKDITSNPYMGKKMPKCGTTEKVITTK